MPHATPERERAFSQRLLDQYRGACGHVHASYSRQIDGVQDLPSTLLESFEDAAAPALAGPLRCRALELARPPPLG